MWIIPYFLYSTMNKSLAVNEAQFLDIILSGVPVRIQRTLAGIVTQVSVITPKHLNVRIILATQYVSRPSRLKCEVQRINIPFGPVFHQQTVNIISVQNSNTNKINLSSYLLINVKLNRKFKPQNCGKMSTAFLSSYACKYLLWRNISKSHSRPTRMFTRLPT